MPANGPTRESPHVSRLLRPGAPDLRRDRHLLRDHRDPRHPLHVAVLLRITEPAFQEYRLPGGLFGQAAVFTEHFHHVGVVRKILLRMVAWMNYVLPLH